MFNYSPTPISNPGPACLLVVVKPCPARLSNIDIYFPARKIDVIPLHHYEYIQALAKGWHQLAASEEITRHLKCIGDLSVGPLQLGASGKCSHNDLRKLLDSIFGSYGYILQVYGRVVSITSASPSSKESSD